MATKTHDYGRYSDEYASLGIEGTYYLAFRDLPKLIPECPHGKSALDYGCGAGRSVRFLKSLGCDAIGVDISHDMLRQAKAKDPSGAYYRINSAQIPFAPGSFELVFSSFVFLEISSREETENVLSEIARVLERDGRLFIVTASPDAYKGKWVSFSYDFPENQKPFHSGDTIKLLIRGTNVVLYDYYWTEEDYARAFEHAGLAIQEVLRPLGHDEDPVKWLEEREAAPLIIFVLAKQRA